MREHLPAVVTRFQPRFVFYLAGCDPAQGDRLGNWRISERGMLARDRFVIEQVRSLRGSVRWCRARRRLQPRGLAPDRTLSERPAHTRRADRAAVDRGDHPEPLSLHLASSAQRRAVGGERARRVRVDRSRLVFARLGRAP
ncbi:MAG: hypothetical protein HC897_12555 [Thermoanaerobaculia bacterium]|nr:hypothetical protein [Thermoanaerobaculia bacterium]